MSENTGDFPPVATAPPPQVPVTFVAAAPVQLQVTPSDREQRRKAAREKRLRLKDRLTAQLAEAQIYEKIGSKVITLNAKMIAKLGEHASTMGIKFLGQGRILIAGDNAHNAVGECDNMIAELRAAQPPAHPDQIAALMGLKLAFNKQLMESGAAHIAASKEVQAQGNGVQMGVPFPAGGTMTLTVEAPQAPPPQAQQLPPPSQPIELPQSPP